MTEGRITKRPATGTGYNFGPLRPDSKTRRASTMHNLSEIPTVSDQQVIHDNPNQITSPDQLQIGQKYQTISIDESGKQVPGSLIEEIVSINPTEKTFTVEADSIKVLLILEQDAWQIEE